VPGRPPAPIGSSRSVRWATCGCRLEAGQQGAGQSPTFLPRRAIVACLARRCHSSTCQRAVARDFRFDCKQVAGVTKLHICADSVGGAGPGEVRIRPSTVRAHSSATGVIFHAPFLPPLISDACGDAFGTRSSRLTPWWVAGSGTSIKHDAQSRDSHRKKGGTQCTPTSRILKSACAKCN
jgi:hypothetical protein